MPTIPNNNASVESPHIINPLPASEDFYLNYPLYKEVDFGNTFNHQIEQLIAAFNTFDSYCPECGEHSVFTRNPSESDIIFYHGHLQHGYRKHFFNCARHQKHKLVFVLYLSEERSTIQKVGQNPSVADLNMHDVKKYALVLSKEYFNELKKAIGLAAHGVGVGSFVYLRRIFESLIEEAKAEALKDDSFDEQAFKTARMNEKIKLLSGHLPPFLVENHQLYGILSKGVHELSEQECLDAFPVVKVGIELILDEHIVEKQRKEKIEATRKALVALSSKK